MSKTIREALLKYGREVYLYTNSANQMGILNELLDQAIREIKDILDSAKPDNGIIMWTDKTNLVDQFQQNINERLL